MSKCLLPLFFLFVFILHQNGFAQSDTKRTTDSYSEAIPKLSKKKMKNELIVVEFDESGKMIQFPKELTNSNQNIIFKVRVSKSKFAEEINKIVTLIDSTHNYFFLNNSELLPLYSNFDTTLVSTLLNDLSFIRTFRSDFQGSRLYDLQSYDDREKQNVFKATSKIVYFPLSVFFDRLINLQYKVDISNNGILNTSIPLSPIFSLEYDASENCYWWSSPITSLKTLLSKNCNDCTKDIQFTLVKQDPFDATIQEWYNTKFKEASKIIDSTNLEKGADSLKKDLEYLLSEEKKISTLNLLKENDIDSAKKIIYLVVKMLKPITESQRSGKDLFEQINDKIPPVLKNKDTFNLSTYISTLKKVEFWIFQWLWYNQGYLVISPLALPEAPSQKRSDSLQKKLKETNRYILHLQQQKDFMDSSMAHIQPALSNFNDFKIVQFHSDSIQLLIDSSLKKLEQINKSIQSDIKTKESAISAEGKIGLTGKFFYSGKIPLYGYSDRRKDRRFYFKELTITKQFNYSEANQSISPIFHRDRDKITLSEIPENEKIQLAIHNLPTMSKLNITHVLTGYNDTEEFTKLVRTKMKELDSMQILKIAQGPGVSYVNHFLTNAALSKRSMDDITTIAVKKIAAVLATKKDSTDIITLNYLQRSAMNSVISGGEKMIVLKKISPKTDSTTGYVSKFFSMSDSTAPYIVTSTLMVDSISTKTTVSVGALHRMQLAAGFALVRSPSQQYLIDTTGNGFRTSSASNGSSAILGVKVYPARSYLRDGSLLPRYPLRRLSIMLATAIPKPLDNFYVGAGYDIVPGLTYTMGWNIYKQNYYQVQNSTVIRSSSSYSNGGVYYGITVNPVVFVEFIKLFFN